MYPESRRILDRRRTARPAHHRLPGRLSRRRHAAGAQRPAAESAAPGHARLEPDARPAGRNPGAGVRAAGAGGRRDRARRRDRDRVRADRSRSHAARPPLSRRVDRSRGRPAGAVTMSIADLRRDYRARALTEARGRSRPDRPVPALARRRDPGRAARRHGDDAGDDGRPTARPTRASCCSRTSPPTASRSSPTTRAPRRRSSTRDPRASLVCFWAELERQVRVTGTVSRATAAASDAYFASRPLDSQLGAWASPQSQVISGREVLDSAVADGRRTIRRQRRASTRVLGRLRRGADGGRVLAGPRQSPARSAALSTGLWRRRLDARAPGAVKGLALLARIGTRSRQVALGVWSASQRADTEPAQRPCHRSQMCITS